VELEIIRPDGTVNFVPLNAAQGVTNIGRDPANDVVLEGAGIAPFHALLDHRQEPCKLLCLSEEALSIDGQRVSADQSIPVAPWSAMEIDGHTLILVTGNAAPSPPKEKAPSAAPAPRATPTAVATESPAPAPAAEPPATPEPTPPVSQPTPQTGPAAAPAGVSALAARPADLSSEIIVAELSDRAQTVNVEESATYMLTVINGGPLVATFNVQVEGVPAEWVTIQPLQVNLIERERSVINITITPPRHPSSRAGNHHIAVVVTSPNHPGHRAQLGATLTINAYHAFAVSELDPREQAVGRRPAKTALHIANQGNSAADFRLEGIDPERACTFEFEVPDQPAPMAQQAEVTLPPDETFVIPIRVTPLRRPFVALRKRRHSFNVNVSMLIEEQMPRTLLGAIKVRPIIGPWLLLLLALLLGALIVLLFRPRLRAFSADQTEIDAGDPVTFTYATSRFTNRWIETSTGERITLSDPAGTHTDSPENDTLYTLRAENLLSQLVPRIFSLSSDPIAVDVTPLEPKIRVFTSDRNTLITGQTAMLRWEVVNADDVVLAINGQEQTLAPAEYTGSREVAPTLTTDYTMHATNQYGGEAVASLNIEVNAPTPTPLPRPIIQRFSVVPLEVYAGNSVTITWQAENATSVELLGDSYPPNGSTVQTLNEIGVVEYVLTALYDDGTGLQPPSRRNSTPVRVTVREKPTPTPEPEPPVIDDFRVVPEEIVLGGEEDAQLVWTISGDTTNVEVTGPTVGTVSNLSPEGTLPVQAEATTFFILTAYNGEELKVSETVELTVIEPTPTPPPTPTPLPEPLIQYFEAEGADNPDDVLEISSDGFTKKYEVTYGAKVKFSWSVLNVAQVTLIAGESSSARPPVGEFTSVIRQAQDYQLVAANEEGATQYAFIQLVLRPIEVPPAPQNLDGTDGPIQSGTPLELTWSYDPNYVDNIVGFRVYRAEVETDLYDRVVDESELDNTARAWEDPSPACGQVYYVTAVYLDVDGQKQETEPSPNHWYSWPCATPTPEP
jgi:hypothetical protein